MSSHTLGMSIVICSLLMGSRGDAREWQMHNLDGSSQLLRVADSVVAVQLASLESSVADAVEFAHLRPELLDTYVPWELTDGFYVFGVVPGLAIETVLEQVRLDPLVRMANPVIQSGSSHVCWMIDQLNVQFRNGIPQAAIDSVNAALSVYANSPDSDRPLLYRVRVRPELGGSSLDVAEAYYATGLCAYAQPNFIRHFDIDEPGPAGLQQFAPAQPDTILPPDADPYYQNQWHWHKTPHLNDTIDADIDADSAWLITKGDTSVRVAILDASFHLPHEDIDTLTPVFAHDCVGETKYLPWPDNYVGIACDSGRGDICAHGTAVFGMLAAAHGNGIGIKGLAPRCSYSLIKCFDDYVDYTDEILAASLRYAWKTARCNIVCNTWWDTIPSAIIAAELQEMRDSGVATFFSTGNNNEQYGVHVTWPASLLTVMAIGATDRHDSLCAWSARGPALDFVAPGAEIWTLDGMGEDGYVTSNSNWANCPDLSYHCSASGTSLSSPIAAGIAALLLSFRPDFMDSTDPAGIIERILTESAEDKGPPGYDTLYGHGRVNAYHALLAACDCPLQGDVCQDQAIDVFDVIGTITVAFSGDTATRDPACTTSRSDVNCDRSTDMLDVVYLAATAFSGGPNPGNPCEGFR